MKNSNNIALSLNGLQTKILNLSADANAKISGESSLTLTAPVYTAVHEAVYANDMLDVINGTSGSRGAVHALKYSDASINETLP